jgi:hypothetical protein
MTTVNGLAQQIQSFLVGFTLAGAATNRLVTKIAGNIGRNSLRDAGSHWAVGGTHLAA